MSMVFYYQINLKFAHILHINNKNYVNVLKSGANRRKAAENRKRTDLASMDSCAARCVLKDFIYLYLFYGVYYIQYPEREEFSKPWRLYLHFYWCRSREKLYLME